MIDRLNPDQLRKTYLPEQFADISESIPEHQMAIIGQKRVKKALRFGLNNRAMGFNIFVAVNQGKEKWDSLRPFLEKLAREVSPPMDLCYVNNFDDSYRPKAIELPSGKGKELKRDVRNFINQLKRRLKEAFQSEEFQQQQNAIQQNLSQGQQEMLAKLNEEAQKEGFVIQRTGAQIVAVPVKDGEPMTDEDFRQLSQEEQQSIMQKQQEFQQRIQKAIRQTQDMQKKVQEEMADLERQTALSVMESMLADLMEKYKDVARIPEYFDSMKEDILENLEPLLREEGQEGQNPMMAQMQQMQKQSVEARYEVNVLVDNSDTEGAPIVVELNPTYKNLFGKIERESVMGTLVTDYTLLRAGALHKANCGYLIIPAKELLLAPFAYENLKRALRQGEVEIEELSEKQGFISAKSLKPEAVELDVQVILIGTPQIYQLLYRLDEDFKALFKVKADFDPVIEANEENLREVAGLLQTTSKKESMLNVNRSAIGGLIEYGHRAAGHREKLSAHFEELADILREANFYASSDSADEVTAGHVRQAIQEKKYRSDLIHEKIKELIEKNVLFIDVEGAKTGQINGLSVLDTGDIMFGRPNRITASVSVGKGNIIDIEREAKLGGPVHTKGVMILSGFLFDKFGKDKPLSLAVRLVFEQSYSGVDGDSASSAELYTILSRLSGLPLKQGIAVTGAVNQKGDVQAVGGINEKIEGFFEVCKQKGLNGEQGVLIPASNTINLMLKEEVVEAVKNDQFHIWPVRTINEGIEHLTGKRAGETYWDEATGTLEFEEDSVYARVNKYLQRMAESWKEYGPGQEAVGG